MYLPPFMLIVVLITVAVVGAWCVASAALAVLAGGVIHARDHRDVPSAAPLQPPLLLR